MLTNIHVRQVEWGECDPAGIVYYPRYLEYFDHATNLLISQASGMGKADLLRAYDFLGYPMVSTQVQYHAPASFGDVVSISSEFSRVGRSSFEVRHRLFQAGVLGVEATDTRVWVRVDEVRAGGIRSCPIPEALAALFRGEKSGGHP